MIDDIFLLIRSKRNNFTDVELIISDYFLSKKETKNINKLSKILAVSESSITRFCKKIGLDNYKELTFLYKLSLEKNEDEYGLKSKTMQSYQILVSRSDNNYSKEKLDIICKKIKKSSNIVFLGKGFNNYVGQDLQFKFWKINKNIRVVSDDNSILMSVHSAKENDVIIVASLRGEDDNLLKAMDISKTKKIFIVLITSNYNSKLIDYSDITLMSANMNSEVFLIEVSPQIPIIMQTDMLYSNYIEMFPNKLSNLIYAEDILTN